MLCLALPGSMITNAHHEYDFLENTKAEVQLSCLMQHQLTWMHAAFC